MLFSKVLQRFHIKCEQQAVGEKKHNAPYVLISIMGKIDAPIGAKSGNIRSAIDVDVLIRRNTFCE